MNISIFKKTAIIIFAVLLSLCLIGCGIEIDDDLDDGSESENGENTDGGATDDSESENGGSTDKGGNATYTVKFDTVGCLPIPDQQVEAGKCAKEPGQVTVYHGYRFDGWDFDFSQPITSDVTVKGIVSVLDEMKNFVFESTETECVVVGLVDYYVTEIVVPDYVTKIEAEAFNRADRLKSLTVPFVGESADCSDEPQKGLLGFLFDGFDDEPEMAGRAITQYYSENKRKEYVIPFYLTQVVVTGNDIPFGAFSGCNSLKEIILQGGGNSIGGRAFSGCSSLTKLDIPEGITSVGDWAFYGCTGITEMDIPDSVVTVGKGAFSGCKALERCDIPETVTVLSDYLFEGCSRLTDFVIHDTVTAIGAAAFKECASLKAVIIPEGITDLNKETFWSCGSLKSVSFPSTLRIIGDYCFSGVAVTELVFPSKLYSIGEGSFIGLGITSLVFPDSFVKLGASAFSDCGLLETVTFGKNFKSLGSSAFEECSKLTEIVIPDSVTAIGAYVFRFCESLTSVTVGSGVGTMGGGVFIGCTSLETVVLKPGLTKIPTDTFVYCDSIKSIVVPDTVTVLGDYAFFGCSIETLYIPATVTEIGKDAFRGLKGTVIFDEANPIYAMIEGCLVDKNTKTVLVGRYDGHIPDDPMVTAIGYKAYYSFEMETLVIPDNVTFIDDEAFGFCEKLTEVYIGSGLETVGAGVFQGCKAISKVYVAYIGDLLGVNFDGWFSNPFGYGALLYVDGEILTELTIPDTVETIGTHVFAHYVALTKLVIPDHVTAMGKGAFTYCTKLESIEIGSGLIAIREDTFSGCSSVTSLILGSRIGKIESFAFNGLTSLTHLVIPKKVTYIDMYAFSNCKALTSVVFENPNGWALYQVGSSDRLESDIDAEKLIDPAYAAEQLTFYRTNRLWKRS